MKTIFALMGMILFVSTTTAFAAPITDVDIYIHGNKQVIPASMGKVFIDNQSRTQVPLRFISERLGHQVVWDSKNSGKITIDKNWVTLNINDVNIKTKGGSLKMDTVPFLKDGRTYVPLRFVSEALGYKVDYTMLRGVNSIFITGGNGNGNGIGEGDEETPITDTIINGDMPYDTTGVDYYKDPNGWGYNNTTKYWIRGNVVGSNAENTKVRAEDSTFKEDIEYLTSLMGRTGYGYSGNDGAMGMGARPDKDVPGDPRSYVLVGNKNGTAENSVGTYDRFIAVRNWVGEKTPMYESNVVQQNAIIEALKYFSKDVEDGKAIFKYLDGQVKSGQYPVLKKVVTFGKTKVSFEEGFGWGFEIYFHND